MLPTVDILDNIEDNSSSGNKPQDSLYYIKALINGK